MRELEWHIDGTQGRSTSRLQKKLAVMNVANTLRVVSSASVKSGDLSAGEWADLLAAYMDMQRKADPLCTTGTRGRARQSHRIHTPAVTPWQPSSISALVLTFRPHHPYCCTRSPTVYARAGADRDHGGAG
jgi:hypothetical protein